MQYGWESWGPDPQLLSTAPPNLHLASQVCRRQELGWGSWGSDPQPNSCLRHTCGIRANPVSFIGLRDVAAESPYTMRCESAYRPKGVQFAQGACIKHALNETASASGNFVPQIPLPTGAWLLTPLSSLTPDDFLTVRCIYLALLLIIMTAVHGGIITVYRHTYRVSVVPACGDSEWKRWHVQTDRTSRFRRNRSDCVPGTGGHAAGTRNGL